MLVYWLNWKKNKGQNRVRFWAGRQHWIDSAEESKVGVTDQSTQWHETQPVDGLLKPDR